MMRRISGILVASILALIMIVGTASLAFAADSVTGVETTSGEKYINVKWDKFSGATHYVVGCGGKNYPKTKKTSYNVDGLKVDTRYGVRVRAYKGDKLIAKSELLHATTLGVKKVTNFQAHSGYKSVTVTFTKVKGATSYQLYRRTKKNGEFTKWKLIKELPKNKTSYRDKKADGRNTKYYYRIRAVKKTKDGTFKSAYSTSSAKPVRQMYQDIKVNGRWHTANGFSGGKYYTLEGNVYSVTSVSSASCDYMEETNYSDLTAENFVNEHPKVKNGKRGKKLIWISTYTQHLYVYQWNTKLKRWKLIEGQNWECSTGKAGSPTPMSPTKRINHKHRTRHGLPWWNCFSSCNAMHGKYDSWEMGVPRSGGCVRNPNYRAEWIYKNCAKGTQVVVW